MEPSLAEALARELRQQENLGTHSCWSLVYNFAMHRLHPLSMFTHRSMHAHSLSLIVSASPNIIVYNRYYLLFQ